MSLKLSNPDLLFQHVYNQHIDKDTRHPLNSFNFIAYGPRINRNLQIFADGHNRAPISTEHGKSPWKLWISGAVTASNRGIDDFWNQVSFLCYNFVVFSQMLSILWCNNSNM